MNMHKLFTVSTEQVRSPYTEHVASGLPNPTHLEEEVRFDQAQDQQLVTTRSPRIVTECLLTRSMLIKMYVYAIYSRFRIGTILSIRKHGYEFITTLSLSNLMSPFSLSCLLRLVDAQHNSIVHVLRCPRQTQHLQVETSFRPEDHTDWEIALPSYDLKSYGSLDLE